MPGALFFTAAATSTSLTLGLPLWRRTASSALIFVATFCTIAGLGMVALPAAAGPAAAAETGAPCLSAGTAIGAIAFFATAGLTGRLWRKMADLSWVTAVGASAVSLAVLNARCPHFDALHLFGFHLPLMAGLFVVARAVLSVRNRALDSA